jgi:hypothetical protein
MEKQKLNESTVPIADLTQQLRLTGILISKSPAPASGKPVIFKADVIQQLDFFFKPIHH